MNGRWLLVVLVLLLAPAKFPGLNHEGARRFAAFVESGAGRGIIGAFGVREFGQAVFELPAAPGVPPR